MPFCTNSSCTDAHLSELCCLNCPNSTNTDHFFTKPHLDTNKTPKDKSVRINFNFDTVTSPPSNPDWRKLITPYKRERVTDLLDNWQGMTNTFITNTVLTKF